VFQALKNGAFLRISLCGFLLTFALMVQEVVLGYELYKATKDPLLLGLMGLAEAIPFMVLALFGGHFADRLNRRSQMLIMLIVLAATSFAIAKLAPLIGDSNNRTQTLWLIYGSIAVMGFARGLYSPAASSLRAQIVRPEDQANASAWSSTFWQAGMLSAPVLAGFSYLHFGLADTLWMAAAMVALAAIVSISLPSLRALQTELPNSIWDSISSGFSFVFKEKILLYSITLDLVAVLFGGVVAILPAFAADVLKVGPEQLGWLRTAPGIGAVMTMLLAARFSPTLRPWRNMLIAVTGFGLATLVFAISESFWLSMLALLATGIFDGISVVVRQYLLQSVPPDHIRGRVLSVNSIFVSASNEIGAFESGVAAKYLGLRSSVLAGASLTLLSAVWLYTRGKHVRLQNTSTHGQASPPQH
jgi:MFS family permease